MKIALVGGYPPPYGGVSVHMQRLYDGLNGDAEIWVIDPYKKDADPTDPPTVLRVAGSKISTAVRLLKALTRCRPDIVHFHLAAMASFLPAGLIFILWARLLGAACILTIHSGSFGRQVAAFGPVGRLSLRAMMALSKHVITVNKEQRDILSSFGLRAGNSTVIPAFLPPKQTKTPAVSALVEAIAEQGNQLYLSSGYGIPLYGFHDIIDALGELENKNSLTLVLCIYNEKDEDYLSALEKKARQAGINLNLTRDLSPEEFSWLLSCSELYIRATDRDGDAVAIREAIHFAIPVVASDCVPRPPVADLFETGNPQSLRAAIENISSAPAHSNTHTEHSGPIENPLKTIENLYQRVVYQRNLSHETSTAKPEKW